MLRLLGAILFIIGLFLVLTIFGWFIGVWFMLFGVLMLVFGGGRRVVVHYRDRPARRRREVLQAKVVEAQPAPTPTAPIWPVRDDAATDFNAAVILYQRHSGHTEVGHAIRELAAETLRQRGFLR